MLDHIGIANVLIVSFPFALVKISNKILHWTGRQRIQQHMKMISCPLDVLGVLFIVALEQWI